jgi:hypothetical protein
LRDAERSEDRLTRIARRALDERCTIAKIVLEEGLLTEARLNELLRLEAMTRPSRIAMAGYQAEGIEPRTARPAIRFGRPCNRLARLIKA